MGLGNTVNKIFLSVADGKIIQKVSEDTPGVVKRINKNNVAVYELRHSYVEGILTGIATKELEFNGATTKLWSLQINDGGTNYQLEMMYDSSYATTMLKAFGNPVVDWLKPIRLAPYTKEVNGKKRTTIYVSQDNGDKKIEWYYTKDNPNGLPDMEKVMFKGKETWDSYNQTQFLEAMVKSQIVPKLKGVSIPSAPAAGISQNSGYDFNAPGNAPDLNSDDPDDQLPF